MGRFPAGILSDFKAEAAQHDGKGSRQTVRQWSPNRSNEEICRIRRPARCPFGGQGKAQQR